MSKFKDFLRDNHHEAYLIDSDEGNSKTKDDYIVDAEEGVIVAFRLNFKAKSGVKLTKVISGKILENNQEDEQYVIETRNGLKYGVPYSAVVWVKTGNRWPKGVYEEMKKGSIEIESEDGVEFEEVDTGSDFDYDYDDPNEHDPEYDDDEEDTEEE